MERWSKYAGFWYGFYKFTKFWYCTYACIGIRYVNYDEIKACNHYTRGRLAVLIRTVFYKMYRAIYKRKNTFFVGWHEVLPDDFIFHTAKVTMYCLSICKSIQTSWWNNVFHCCFTVYIRIYPLIISSLTTSVLFVFTSAISRDSITCYLVSKHNSYIYIKSPSLM